MRRSASGEAALEYPSMTTPVCLSVSPMDVMINSLIIWDPMRCCPWNKISFCVLTSLYNPFMTTLLQMFRQDRSAWMSTRDEDWAKFLISCECCRAQFSFCWGLADWPPELGVSEASKSLTVASSSRGTTPTVAEWGEMRGLPVKRTASRQGW